MEIEKYARKLKIPYFRGVFMRDTLPSSGPWKNENAIVNLDLNEGSGTHWVAYKKRANAVIYFDSFGDLQPPVEVIKYLKCKNILYNYDKHQTYNTSNCGALCLKFLKTCR